MNVKTNETLKAILLGLLGGALLMLLVSLGCGGGASDDPPDNSGTTDDHGNDIMSATPIMSGMQVAGNIETGDDEDYFSIEVTEAGLLRAAATGDTDTVGTIYDSEGNELAMDDNSGADMNFNVSTLIAAAGTYYIRVTSSEMSTGMYTLTATFILDDHGDDITSPTPAAMNTPITGNLEKSDDQDYFSIQVTNTDLADVDFLILTAAATGETDTVGTLYDSQENELATDDNSGADMNFIVSTQTPSPGTYYVRVTGEGSATGMYTLTITSIGGDYGNRRDRAAPLTPGTAVAGNIDPSTDEDYFSVQVTPMDDRTILRAVTTGATDTMGTLYDSDGTELAMDDDGGADMNFDVSAQVVTSGTYYVKVASPGTATGRYTLTVTVTSSEYGNMLTNATPVTTNTPIIGNIETNADRDHFSIQVTSGDLADVDFLMLTAATTGTTDTMGALYNGEGTRLATDDNSGADMNFSVSTRVSSPGIYYVRVVGEGSATGMYTLTITSIGGDYGNTRASATQATSGTAISGNIDPGTDEDYFSVQVTPMNDRTILRAVTSGTTDTVGYLYDSDGTELATDDNGGANMNFDVSAQITTAGTYYIRVVSEGSATGRYTLTVTTTSSEYGNAFTSATPITSGTAISGNIDPGTNADYFSIQLAEGGMLRAKTTGGLDTVGTIYNSGETQVATDDNSGTDMNFDVSYSVTSAGTYYIRVEGSATGRYTLTVTFITDDHGNERASATSVTSGTAAVGNIETGDDEDYFSIQVPDTNDLTTLTATTTGNVDTVGYLYDSRGNQLATDDNGGMDMNFSVSAQVITSGTYYIRVVSKGSATGMYSLTVTAAAGDHGNTRASATQATPGTAISGNIDPGTDEDYFSVQVTPMNDRTILRAVTSGTTDTVGYLYDSGGNQLATDDNGGAGMNFDVSTQVVTAGTYYIRVVSEGSATGRYRLTVTSTSSEYGNTIASATPVTSGTPVLGGIERSNDQDYFSIQVSRADLADADFLMLTAATTGTTDTVGTLYNNEGTQLTTDDNSGEDMNFSVSTRVLSPGTYYIRVEGMATGRYALTVTTAVGDHGNTRASATRITSGAVAGGNITTDGDEDYFAIQVTPMNDVTILRAVSTGSTDIVGYLYDSGGDQLAIDDNSGTDMNFDVSARITTTGTYYVRVTSSGTATGGYALTVTITSSEYGNAIASATPVVSGTAISGNIDTGTNEDYFSIQASGKGMLRAKTTGSLDTVGTILNSGGDPLATDDNSGAGMNFSISHSITSAGTYYVRVASEGTATGRYTLTVTFIADDHGNERASATRATSGTAIDGNIETGDDEDYFSIQVTGTNDLVTLTATTTGMTNTIGTIYDSRGNQLATDDNSGEDMNFDVSAKIPGPGSTFYIKVASEGTATGEYSLTVTTTNTDHGNTRATATPLTGGQPVATGERIAGDTDYFSIQVSDVGVLRVSTTGTNLVGRVYDSGENGENIVSDGLLATISPGFSVQITSPGTYYIELRSISGTYTLTVRLPDHGNQRAFATPVASGTPITGHIQASDDEDYFLIVVPGSSTLTAVSTGSVDTIGYLYDTDGTTQLATNDDDGEGGNFSISQSITTAGTYYVRVIGKGTATGRYSLTLISTGGDHGNTAATATPVAIGGVPIVGNIATGDDEDYFSIETSLIDGIRASTTGDTDTVGHIYEGEKQIATDDNSGAGMNFSISTHPTPVAPRTHYVRVTSKGMATGKYTLTIAFDDHSQIVSTNEGPVATPVTSGTPVIGNLETEGDQDLFSIEVSGAGTLRATTTSNSNVLGLDIMGTIFGGSSTGNVADQLATHDDISTATGNLNFDVSAQITTSGPRTCYIRVENGGGTITTGRYLLTVTFTPSSM